jgi:hypothetical protein
MQMQMLICGRDWCDFVVYNPNFKKPIQITRIEAAKTKQDDLLVGFQKGEEIIKNLISKVEEKLK